MSFYSSDPYYEHGPAGWVRERAQERGVRVELDYDLEFPGYRSLDRQTIVARPGLSLPSFHWLVACGVLAHIFGSEAVPDLPIGPPVSRDAQVLPFRGPAFTFWDNQNRFRGKPVEAGH
jgi:hypothetical protein